MLTKYEKVVFENSDIKKSVLDILQVLNGTSVADSLEILNAVKYFVRSNATFIVEPAELHIESLRE